VKTKWAIGRDKLLFWSPIFIFNGGKKMNKRFLIGVIQASPDGSKGSFARQYKIDPGRLSELIRGYRSPTKSELEKLSRAFSDYRLNKFFPEKDSGRVISE
jgi:hypothetical protein